MVETDIFRGNLNLQETRLCLDFANTTDWHASDHPEESLNSYADLVNWATGVALLTGADAQQLRQMAAQTPAVASATLARAIDLREAVYRIFSAVAADRAVADPDLTILNTWLAEAAGRLEVAQTGDGFAWRWHGQAEALACILWPVAQSAAELLTSEELSRVKQCADDRGCGWLFLDTSRNRSRRWCSMQGCGNRAKVRRYRRQQAA